MSDPEGHPEKLLTVEQVPSRTPSRASGLSARTGPSGMQTQMKMKVILDERQRTMEGFRSLAVFAIFLAGLQAQMIQTSFSRNSSALAHKFTDGFWFAGIFCDVFGAVLAMLTARWFEVLHPPDVEFLNNTWAANKEDIPPPTPEQSRRHAKGLMEYLVAMALFSGLGVVAAGVALFFIGLMIFIWAQQPLLVSIIATIPFFFLSLLVCSLFVPHHHGKKNIIEILARKKGSW